MGKKNREEMAAQREKFLAGMRRAKSSRRKRPRRFSI
jgi:DNA polymerase III alpha subunit